MKHSRFRHRYLTGTQHNHYVKKTGQKAQGSELNKLQTLAEKDSSEILFTLCSVESEFLKHLYSNIGDRNLIAFTLIAINKACKSPHRNNVMSLLSTIFHNKQFSQSLLPQYLTEFLHCNSSSHQTESLEIFPDLLFCFFDLFPALATGVISIVVPLLKDACEKVFKQQPDILKSLLEKVENIDERNKYFIGSHSKCDVIKAAEATKYYNEQPTNCFRSVSIFPTIDDIRKCETFIRPIISIGSYADVEHYLDIQFRLLREDYIETMRKGIVLYSEMKKQMNHVPRIQEVKIYLNVKVLCWKVNKEGSIIYTAMMDIKSYKHINWEQSKRLRSGSLISLSSDNFETFFFAMVVETDDKDLRRGLLTLKFLEDFGLHGFNLNQTFVMLESDAYFEAYQHNLAALCELNSSNFPMQKYIIFAQKQVESPSYLNAYTMYNMHSLLPSIYRGKNESRILDDESWPSYQELNMHKSQYEALKAAVTKELAIIQGPPGTGKTYIGLKIVQLLISNASKWGSSPILVVCYTNHALDQFLEGILRFNTNIIRIGSRSKSEEIKKHMLHEKRKQFSRIDHIYKLLKEKKQQMSSFKHHIDIIYRRINVLYEVLSIRELQHVIFPQHLQSLLYVSDQYFIHGSPHHNIILEWLEDYYFDDDLQLSYAIETEDFFQRQLEEKTEMDKERMMIIDDVWELNTYERWQLYRYWRNEFINQQEEKLLDLQKKLFEMSQELKEIRDEQNLKVLSSAAVVGMTTTGAAKNYQLLQQLGPEIVVIEEAAEILESHVITSLSSSTKHLILIGDHQQLRPKATVYELVVKFNLDLSLFERLVKNGVEYHQLLVQHRMRPKIASLIVPHIYPLLENHASVLEMENIKGVVSNVHFITHNISESNNSDSQSKINIHEAEFLLQLCIYFLKQGYRSSQITILTTYSGQMFAIKNIINRDGNDLCKDVRVAVVDNYQGEENDIILISFVRSNPERRIGFLKVHNRVCVALSRARKGLFCIGNFLLYAEVSELWKSIVETLERNNSISTSLRLQCQNHPETFTDVSRKGDFSAVPDGGCSLDCNYTLQCGHKCAMKCHPTNPQHQGYKCMKDCVNLCEREHKCRKRCFERCRCTVRVEKILTPCNHIAAVPCHEFEMETKCLVNCDKTLLCGHKCKAKCFEECSSFQCTEIISVKLQCGHKKELRCYLRSYLVDNEKCIQNVSIKLLCGHQTMVQCSESSNVEFFTYQCISDCETRLLCGHVCRGSCSTCHHGRLHEACREKCSRVLICGHLCEASCSKPCPLCKKCAKLMHTHSSCNHEYDIDDTSCPEQETSMLDKSDSSNFACLSINKIKGIKRMILQCEELIKMENTKQEWIKTLKNMKSQHSCLFKEMATPLLKAMERNKDFSSLTWIRFINIINVMKCMFSIETLYRNIPYHNIFSEHNEVYKFTEDTRTLIIDFINTEYLTATEEQLKSIIRELQRYEYLVRLLHFRYSPTRLPVTANKYYEKPVAKIFQELCTCVKFEETNEKAYLKIINDKFPDRSDLLPMYSKGLVVFSLSFSDEGWKDPNLSHDLYVKRITYADESKNS